MAQELQPDELAVLRGPVILSCVICDEPTDDNCPICGASVCNICIGEHYEGSCEVFFD
jgi:hypothetical protein